MSSPREAYSSVAESGGVEAPSCRLLPAQLD